LPHLQLERRGRKGKLPFTISPKVERERDKKHEGRRKKKDIIPLITFVGGEGKKGGKGGSILFQYSSFPRVWRETNCSKRGIKEEGKKGNAS